MSSNNRPSHDSHLLGSPQDCRRCKPKYRGRLIVRAFMIVWAAESDNQAFQTQFSSSFGLYGHGWAGDWTGWASSPWCLENWNSLIVGSVVSDCCCCISRVRRANAPHGVDLVSSADTSRFLHPPNNHGCQKVMKSLARRTNGGSMPV